MILDMEKRTAPLGIEVRAEDSGKKTLAGYAAVFDSPTDIGWFREQISPGAFADAIVGDVRCLFDHKSSFVLGRTKAGTLRLAEDSRGLKFEVDLPDTQIGRDVATSVERGDISGMSFNFRAIKETWDESVSPPLRTLLKLEIDEVSVTAFPAYEDTKVALRSLEEYRSANAVEPPETTKEIPVVAPAMRVASAKTRLKMDLDLKLRK